MRKKYFRNLKNMFRNYGKIKEKKWIKIIRVYKQEIEDISKEIADKINKRSLPSMKTPCINLVSQNRGEYEKMIKYIKTSYLRN